MISSRWQKLSIPTSLQLSRGMFLVFLTDKYLIFDLYQWFSYMFPICVTGLSVCSYIWPVAQTEQILCREYCQKKSCDISFYSKDCLFA